VGALNQFYASTDRIIVRLEREQLFRDPTIPILPTPKHYGSIPILPALEKLRGRGVTLQSNLENAIDLGDALCEHLDGRSSEPIAQLSGPVSNERVNSLVRDAPLTQGTDEPVHKISGAVDSHYWPPLFLG